MVTELSVKNFRGLSEITIPLSTFTLIGGDNNVGKTTVLESLFMLYGHFNPVIFPSLNNFRKEKSKEATTRVLWENLFYNYNMKNPVVISALRDNEYEILKMGDNNGVNSVEELTLLENPSTSLTNLLYNDTEPLNVSYQRNELSTNFKYTLTYDEKKIPVITIQENVKANANRNLLRICFFGNISQSINLYNLIGKLNQTKKTENIIDLLKTIDNRVKDIVLGENQQIFLDVDGLSEMLPLSSMGSGVTTVIYWAAVALTDMAKLLLIDEIGDGIHYSHMELVISKLYDICKLCDCQIIATTHSLDCIRAFSNYNADNTADNINSQYIRLERNRKNNSIDAISIDPDKLKRMLNSEWEVR